MVNVGMPVRNLFMPPARMMAEMEIKSGDKILDYGCGPGTFTLMMAEKTGPSGVVHALDIHPRAVKMVQAKAFKKGLSNIKTILSGCATDLDDESLDLVVCFDVFHMVENRQDLLGEIYRVMKPDAVLYFSDHHMKEKDLLEQLTQNRWFELRAKGRRTISLGKVSSPGKCS